MAATTVPVIQSALADTVTEAQELWVQAPTALIPVWATSAPTPETAAAVAPTTPLLREGAIPPQPPTAAIIPPVPAAMVHLEAAASEAAAIAHQVAAVTAPVAEQEDNIHLSLA